MFFWEGLKILEYEFGMDKNDIVQFMCSSVASAIASEERAPMFWDGLEKLTLKYEMDKDDLVTKQQRHQR